MLTRLATRRPLLVVVTCALITITGGLLASRLQLQTDLAELLPRDAPSVTGLHALARRVGGTGNIAIAIESPSGPGPLRAYVPRLADALRAGLGKDLLSLRYSRQELVDFSRRFAAYYAPLDDLERWSQHLSQAIAMQNPAYVSLDDGNPMSELVSELRKTRDELGPNNAADPQTNLFMAEGGHLAVMFVRPATDTLDLGSGGAMLDRIDQIIAATDPGPSGVRIAGFTGSIPVALTEVAAIRHDIVETALLVLLGVGAAVVLYFRGIRELLFVGAAVVFGTSFALGFAELWIGHVNAQTAFLGAIIAGTGINYGIILLDRYRRARAASQTTAEALETAIGQAFGATAIAALATVVSFGVLAAGEVESFHQFGWIGGLGILTCWIGTFTLVPALVVLADRDSRPRRPPGVPFIERGFSRLGRACETHRRMIVGAAVLAVATSAAVAVQNRHDVIETNLRKLGTRSADTSGVEKLDNRLRVMDDRSSTPAVIATHDRSETQAVCDQLNARARTDLKGILRRCYSIDDLIPQDLDRRGIVLDKLRHSMTLIDDDDIAPEGRADVAELRRIVAEPPPHESDLPRSLVELFVERNGSVGNLAFVEPNDEHIEANLYKFTDAIRVIPLPSGRVLESSGELVVFADVLRAMRRDAVKLTLAAAAMVLLVLALVSRNRGTFVRVGGALIAGVLVMLGLAVVNNDKLNFFNFVALPTTFGIGIDYAINIDARLRQLGRAHIPLALSESAPSVVLASITTIIGYASLLIADSRALASFGQLAILGELACITVAVVLVPALFAMTKGSGSRTGA